MLLEHSHYVLKKFSQIDSKKPIFSSLVKTQLYQTLYFILLLYFLIYFYLFLFIFFTTPKISHFSIFLLIFFFPPPTYHTSSFLFSLLFVPPHRRTPSLSFYFSPTRHTSPLTFSQFVPQIGFKRLSKGRKYLIFPKFPISIHIGISSQ